MALIGWAGGAWSVMAWALSAAILALSLTQSVHAETKATGSHTSESWQLVRDDPSAEIALWSRRRGDALPNLRATAVIDAPLLSLAAVLLDSSRAHEWVYRTREARSLESQGPLQGVMLFVTSMPWPLADREVVVAWSMKQDPETFVITLAGRAVAGHLPQDPSRVRMPLFESLWQLRPRADGRVDVLFEAVADPGGNLSLAPLRQFVAMAMQEGPRQTVLALREIVRRPTYARPALPGLRSAPR